jgi:hypothetical protein
MKGDYSIAKLHVQLQHLSTDHQSKYSSAPVPTGSTFQDLPQLCETADNTECYI